MNTHPSAVLLQALEDGEVGARRRATLETHLAVCARCRDVRAELRALSRDFSDALSGLDRAGESALARLGAAGPQGGLTAPVRQVSDRPWLRAAMIATLLVTASSFAGLSALWLTERLASDEAPALVTAAPAAAPAFTSGFTLVPATADLRVELAGLTDDSRVLLRLVDDDRVSIDVVAADAPVRFNDQRPGRIDVTVNGRAEVTLSLPRSLAGATVVVDGVVRATRRGGELDVPPAAGGVTVVREGGVGPGR